MAMAWMAMAMVLYLMRPQSMRNSGDQKPPPNQGGPHGGPGRDDEPPAVM